MLTPGPAAGAVIRAGSTEVTNTRPRAAGTTSVVELHNNVIAAKWSVGDGGLRLAAIEDRVAHRPISLDDDLFVLRLHDGDAVRSSKMKVLSAPQIRALSADSGSSNLAQRSAGREIAAELEDSAGHLHVTWRAILRDGSNYLRTEVTIRANGQDVPVAEIRLIGSNSANAHVVGTVKGSPAVKGNDFLAFEHPLSSCEVEQTALTCSLKRELPIRAGQSATYSAVIGVTRPGQLRRDFLNYVERERAHPYRTFLHYNTWYDLGYFGRYDEAGVLDRISAFGSELTKKRGVKLDSFLLDDGWDDPTHLWHFNPGFPDALQRITATAADYAAAPGMWLSPWGGYGQPKQQRLESAHHSGYETYQGGLALSSPHYFEYFRKVCLDVIEHYGVNQFKFDGTGNADRVIPGSSFDSDFDAAISLISELRSHKPDLYVNLTTGTYPSPFWLRYADSIWRGGEDHDFAGVGTARQRWITYRDGATYEHVVQAGPLFPLSSLMLHGLIYAQHAKDLSSDPGNDFADEVHSYFGTGTQLQEMYITPSLLSSQSWDVLAAAAKWSRHNAEVLRDTHWIGGDPRKLEVYGWAAWWPEKGIVTLRNPSDHTQEFLLDVSRAFELPSGAARSYRVSDVWTSGNAKQFVAGRKEKIELKPFEVLTLEARPVH
ncbi:MAG TPA: enterotoxin [Terriglobales bacterium]|nr:enterotoxin [Terriglobales bacterium]